MNILILSWRGPGHPNAGGAEQVTHEHAKAWVINGHSVTLFTASYEKAIPSEIIDGVEIVRKGEQIFVVKLAAFFWYIFGKHKKYDLVIDHFHGIPFFTPLYIKSRKLAFIHEVSKEVWRLNPWKKPFNLIPIVLGTKIEPFMFKYLYRRIPFLTGSKSTMDDLVEWNIPKNNITVIHHGVKLAAMPNKLPARNAKKTVLFLGAISRDKGIFEALEVFKDINRKDDSWEFWIAGKADKSIQKLVVDKIKEIGLIKKVKIFGFVSERKKFELFAKAHVFINPSIREGWGLVNIEANACGTPVVAFNVAGSRDSVKNNKTGVLVKYGDTHSMAYQIFQLTRNEGKYNNFSQNCIAWSKKYTWEKATQESLRLIESI